MVTAFRATAIALFGCVLAGCSFPEQPIPNVVPVVVVQAVLDLGSATQSVTVRWSDRGLTIDQNIIGAALTLRAADGQHITAIDEGTGRYSFLTGSAGFPLVGGSTYSIDVGLPWGETVTGTTTVPTALPVSLTPAAQTLIRSRDTARVAWRPVTGAAAYEVRVYPTGGGNQAFADPTYVHFVTDTSVALAGTLVEALSNNDVFRLGRRSTVVVTAVDENYYQYMRVLADPLAGIPPSRLVGGIGVLGAIVQVAAARYDVR